ncbi:hypothetical protein F2Q70_00016936 [Brassica cretica]|uniref:Uncharacterized protein n=1 Tax=Brassica cretica TaxID=69181 RepID=A0A3N6Q0Y5_BRACR|nr:hypothetical protein F2Q70_00016936 [Brassica cretica]KAF2597843.1 hypothetical protein F2Q68_00009899 [Brassica cretica]
MATRGVSKPVAIWRPGLVPSRSRYGNPTRGQSGRQSGRHMVTRTCIISVAIWRGADNPVAIWRPRLLPSRSPYGTRGAENRLPYGNPDFYRPGRQMVTRRG